MEVPKLVRICQNCSCRKLGAAKVLAAFQARSLSGVTIEPCGCLGQCGNGPMVLVLPDQVWYSQVQPDEVPAILERHLLKGHPVTAMLYQKFHPRSPEAGGTTP